MWIYEGAVHLNHIQILRHLPLPSLFPHPRQLTQNKKKNTIYKAFNALALARNHIKTLYFSLISVKTTFTIHVHETFFEVRRMITQLLQ